MAPNCLYWQLNLVAEKLWYENWFSLMTQHDRSEKGIVVLQCGPKIQSHDGEIRELNGCRPIWRLSVPEKLLLLLLSGTSFKGFWVVD